ncbi:MAG: serine hydrolase [Sphingobacteriales bacterium]|nr:serine hydrolase [Sphingobacteriales bacterium]
MFLKKWFTIILVTFACSIHAQPTYFPPLSGTTWDTLSPNRLGWCQPKIDSLYNYLESTGTDAFIILKDGKIVLEKYFGLFTQDSIHYWASAGKSLTAMMVGIAQQKGLLNINDSVSRYLGVGWTSETRQKEKLITIKSLLTMTGGMDDQPASPCDNLSQLPACLQYKADAGTRWSYHTGAYRKLEDVVSTVTGQNYTAATNTFIGSKIGMNGLWFQSVYYSKPRDMARFGLLALNKGIWHNDTVLRDTAYYRAMTNTSQNFNLSYGYLWWLNGKASAMVPYSQIVFPVKLIRNAPDDLICALGKNDQKIYVVPSQKMVIVRVGGSAYEADAVSTYDTLIWSYINRLSDGCMASTVIENKIAPDLRLFPNPANNFITFRGMMETSTTHYIITNLYGQTISEGDTQNHTLDISALSAGTYILMLQNEGRTATGQFIKL